MSKVICYAFDVDETLEISHGPVKLEAMQELRRWGHIVGICGNMHVFCSLPDWHERVSFLGQGFLPKEAFLHGLKINIRADDFVMVGNVGPDCAKASGLPQSGSSADWTAATKAGWRFLTEKEFAEGKR